MLQTRTTKYGQLSRGILVVTKPKHMLRQSRHIHEFDFGVRIILGCNGDVILYLKYYKIAGYIWLTAIDDNLDQHSFAKIYRNMITLRQIILCLSCNNIKINQTIIMDLYNLFNELHPQNTVLNKERGLELICKYAQKK